METYKAIAQGVVETYEKIEDKFVQNFLAREGENHEEAKERLSRK